MIRTTMLALGCSLVWGTGCVSVTYTDGTPGQGGGGGGQGGDTITGSGAGGGDVTASGAGGGGGAGGVSPTLVTAIAAGADHTCAVRGGEVYCWGSNEEAQLGRGNDPAAGGLIESTTPLVVANLSGVTQLALGESHSCALEADGAVLCWGLNEKGQLGDPGNTQKRSPAPVQVGSVHLATAIAVGAAHGCAIIDGGSGGSAIHCWGDNDKNQLGANDPTLPAPIPDLTGVRGISAGGRHSCAIVTSTEAPAQVWCWGDNNAGQVGRLSGGEFAPTPVSGGFGTAVAELALGAEHSCLRTDNDRVWCWGQNEQEQLGRAGGGQSSVPQELTETFSRIAAGYNRTCGWSDGGVYCWGDIGPDQTAVATPTDNAGLKNVTAVAIGRAHICALRANGEVLCWGSNASGQLGVSGLKSSDAPIEVAWPAE